MKRILIAVLMVAVCAGSLMAATDAASDITDSSSSGRPFGQSSPFDAEPAGVKPSNEKKQRPLTAVKSEDDMLKQLEGAQRGRQLKRAEKEKEPSALERSFARKSITLQDKQQVEEISREYRQFGYEFFQTSTQLDAVMGSLPVGDDYQVGPGDRLMLSVWGSLDGRFEVLVDRNGEITIPKAGNVYVWGMSLAGAREAIDRTLGRYFKNYQMTLTMARLRTIQVFVVGEVETPGSYHVSSLATVVNALAAAGGPAKNGSLRTIRVNRSGKIVAEVDLYDLFLNGDRSRDLRLQNGDTIFIPVIGPVVAVAGEVRRPAIYEMNGPMSLAQVLKMAGGVTASGDTARMQLERLVENRARIVQDIHPGAGSLDDTLSKVTMQDRDMVKVPSVQAATRQIVTLKGNVLKPGDYEYRPGMRLTGLIPSTQALMPESYLDAVEVVRLLPPDYRREVLSVNLRKALAGNEQDNIILREQDTVRIFSRADMVEKPKVSIGGSVVKPGDYEFQLGMTIRDLVMAAGSPLRSAYLGQAELSRIVISGDNASTRRIMLDLNMALTGDPQNNLTLQQDDILLVRGVSEWSNSNDKVVTLQGEVRFPGAYSITKGEKLTSLIARAGGFTEKAYLRGAKFLRMSVREEQQKRLEEVVVRTEKEVLQKQATLTSLAASKEELEATKVSLEAVSKGLERMKLLKAEGRVVVKLKPLEELQKSSYDLVLEGGDAITVPAIPSVVNVMGFVYNPLSLVYQPDSSDVDSCLKQAGGATNDAEPSEMYIIRADGTVFSRLQSSFGMHWSEEAKRWSFGSFMSAPLEPGDSLVVPQKIERIAWLRDIKDITTIMSQVALTAGTVLLGLR